jgi:murein L,D-transpeptidase YafK
MMKIKPVLFILAAIAVILLFMVLKSESAPLPPGVEIDKLIVEKSKREMHALCNGTVVKTYSIALGSAPEGHKEYEGDMKTPEGIYTIDSKNPKSAYYLNLGISYPNATDRTHAASIGKSPGGDIKIHGLKNGMGYIGKAHLLSDWTHGCIALTNEEMEELFKAVPLGTTIEIKP